MVRILQLEGTARQLYQLVGPLVMDPEVLRANNNYPFKTTDKYVWFVAVKSKKVVGFIPVEQRNEMAIINNYYIGEKQEKLLPLLIDRILSALGTDKIFSSVTLIEHQSIFEKCGFVVEKEWKRYVKMIKE